MQRLVIDTNVLVSGMLTRSYPYQIIRSIFLSGNISLCISSEVFEEYQQVLNRPKFSKYPDFLLDAERLLVNIDDFATKYTPTVRLSLIKDQSDNKFLELAAACKADFLITGNTNDFVMKAYRKTRIVTPKEYWEEHREYKIRGDQNF